MNVGSLFAGVGGFDIAAERAGMEVVWQSEVDDAASRVLEHHWPGLNRGDVHDITDTAGVDVLCGGFPCQDYSVAGQRAGLAGDRGALWWEYHRLITEGRPTWVVAENVPGLLSSRGGRDFATIIDSLTECGYGVTWAVLDAQYFGVAQRRRRVFIVGHSGGQPRPEVLALSEGVFGHPAPSRETEPPVAALTANGVGAGGGPDDNAAQAGHVIPVGSHGSGDYTGTVTTTWAKGPGNTQVEEGALVAFAQNTRDEVRIINGDGQISGALAAEAGMKQQTYLATAATLTQGAPSAGRRQEDDINLVVSPQVRRLTPLERERLQGFPDGWTDIPGNSDTQRYRQMGNAVAVPVVEWIMRRIADTVEPPTGGGVLL